MEFTKVMLCKVRYFKQTKISYRASLKTIPAQVSAQSPVCHHYSYNVLYSQNTKLKMTAAKSNKPPNEAHKFLCLPPQGVYNKYDSKQTMYYSS